MQLYSWFSRSLQEVQKKCYDDMLENLSQLLLPKLPHVVIIKIMEFIVEDVETIVQGCSMSNDNDFRCFDIDSQERLEIVQDLYGAIAEIFKDFDFYPKNYKVFTRAYYNFSEDSIMESMNNMLN